MRDAEYRRQEEADAKAKAERLRTEQEQERELKAKIGKPTGGSSRRKVECLEAARKPKSLYSGNTTASVTEIEGVRRRRSERGNGACHRNLSEVDVRSRSIRLIFAALAGPSAQHLFVKPQRR